MRFFKLNVQDLEQKRNVQGLLQTLQETDPAVRRNAAAALGRLGDASATGGLCGLLKDADPAVRVAAAEALGKAGDAEAVPPLCIEAYGGHGAAEDALKAVAARHLQVLRDALKHVESTVRGGAARVLGDLHDTQSAARLMVALKDRDPKVRRLALVALAKLEQPQAFASMVETLKDADVKVRLAAVEVLGRLHDPRMVEPLCSALSDSDESVRRQAIAALGPLADSRAVEHLAAHLFNPDGRVNREAVASLRQIGDSRVAEWFIEAIDRVDPRHRDDFPPLFEALGELHDPRAVTPICNWMATHAMDVEVIPAAQALRKLGDPAAAGALSQAFEQLSHPQTLARERWDEQMLDKGRRELHAALFRVREGTKIPAGEAALREYLLLAREYVCDDGWFPSTDDGRAEWDTKLRQLQRGQDAAVPALLQVIQDYRGRSDDSIRMRARLCEALGAIGSPSASAALEQIIAHQSDLPQYQWIQSAAARALQERRGQRPARSLIHVICEKCQAAYDVSSDLAGRSGRCKCGNSIRIPAAVAQ